MHARVHEPLTRACAFPVARRPYHEAARLGDGAAVRALLAAGAAVEVGYMCASGALDAKSALHAAAEGRSKGHADAVEALDPLNGHSQWVHEYNIKTAYPPPEKKRLWCQECWSMAA